MQIKNAERGLNLAETIREIIHEHLLIRNGVVMGQCLLRASNVAGTIPELTKEQGILELSMSDVMGSYIAVGYALAGRRPIYVVRYQGFQWFNAPALLNYARISKEMWGNPCPVFIRSIGMDGSGGPTIGPVASCSQHGMFTRMPKIPCCAPMTPGEYKKIWQHYLDHDDPLFVDEYRTGYPIDYEMSDIVQEHADITLYPISSTRLNALKAVDELSKLKIKCNVIHLLWLKPFVVNDRILGPLENSLFGGIILDTDFENGTAKCMAADIMLQTSKKVRVLGLEERCHGFAPHFDNQPPSAEKICSFVQKIVNA